MTGALIDYIIFFGYFIFVIGIAIWVSTKPKGEDRTSEDFFLAGRALPWWIIGASLIASNISAEQMIAMAGSTFAGGIAIISYEWMAAVTLLIVAKWFLPIFLKMRIFSMPQYLERRFDGRVSSSLGVFWLLVYVFVNLTTVMYLGALTLNIVMGFPLQWGIIMLACISAVYTIYGGLSAVAWTDFVQVSTLFIGGLVVTFFGLSAVGNGEGLLAGWNNLLEQAPDHFHTMMAWDHNLYPWIGVFFGGLWIANLSYWGCNQYIIQRALAAKNVREAQHGLVFAAFLKIIVPLIAVLPGVIAVVLFSDTIKKADQTYATLIVELIPPGFTGIIIAALIAAIVSSLNSMTNSSATIFTMDIYRKIRPNASEKELVRTGRITSAVALIIAILIAPAMTNLKEAFQYIQEYTGFVSPGVVAIFMFGLFWKRATSTAALWMAILTIPLSTMFKFMPKFLNWAMPDFTIATTIAAFIDPFLNRMGLTFLLLALIGYIISIKSKQPVTEKKEFKIESYQTSAIFNVCAILILGVLSALYLIFW